MEIHSEAQVVFENGFISKVKASFKEDLGNNTIIRGKEGEIFIKNTFLGINEINVFLKNKNYKIKKKINRNIYSLEIENISQNILDGENKILFPGMQTHETILNMEILESWRND